MAATKGNRITGILKDTLALVLITVIAGGLLGFVYELTKDKIAGSANEEKLEAYAAVFEEADSFNWDNADLADIAVSDAYLQALADEGVEDAQVMEAYQALDASGNVIGYVMTTDSSKGYSGQISISLGVTLDGTITGMRFLVLNETAGFGLKAAEPEFTGQFPGKKEEKLELGTNMDAISSATITSKAVKNALNAGLVFVKLNAAQ